MVAGDLVNTASRVQSLAPRRRRARRRGDAPRRRGGDRVRGRRRARAQGQGRAAAPVAGGPRRRRARRRAARRPASSRRSSAASASCGWSRSSSRRPRRRRKAHLVSVVGIAGIGKSPAGLGVREVRRRPRPRAVWWHRGRCLAYGEGVDVLGAGRDGADARRGSPRPTTPTTALGKLAGDGGRARPRRRGAALGGATRSLHLLGLEEGAGARAAGHVRRVAAVLRAAQRAPAGRHGVRGHPVGRRRPARLHRVPARVVARAPDLHAHARRGPSWPTGGPAGARASAAFTSLYLEPLPAAAMAELMAGFVPGLGRRPASSGSSSAPRASRCTRSRRCACCSTAACSCRTATATGRPGRSTRSRSPRRCTR